MKSFEIEDTVIKNNTCGTIKKIHRNSYVNFFGQTMGPYPLLYSIRWENGEVNNCCLPDGLMLCDRKTITIGDE